MIYVKLSQEIDVRTPNSVVFIEYNWIHMDTIEHSWKFYLKLKIKGIIITHKNYHYQYSVLNYQLT